MECIIHYKHLKVSEKLIAVTESTYKTLKDSKDIRLELGGENLHYDQCCGVPDQFNENVPLFHHREYRSKFTYVQTLKKSKVDKGNADEEPNLKRSKCTDDTFFFPNHCMFCKKSRIAVKKKEIKLSKIVTVTAQETLMKAAEFKNDFERFGSISGVDLIAKEFQKHDTCYRVYTGPIVEMDKNTVEKNERMYERGNFENVRKTVDDLIIGQMKCISIQSLLQIYGPLSWPKQYRHKLKSRLLEIYGDKLLFVTADENSPQLVINKQCLERNATSLKHSDEFVVKEAANILKRSILQQIDDSPDVPWSPTVNSLDSREPPEILKMFYDSYHLHIKRIYLLIIVYWFVLLQGILIF